MDRRQFLALAGSAGAVATAGCNAPGGSTSLSNPTVRTDSGQRRSLHFTENGEEVASLGVSGYADPGLVDLQTELSHREGTEVTSIKLRVWMPTADGPATSQVGVVSPVEGDSSPPPEVSLSAPRDERGTVVEVTDLDDLADETISTLGLLVRPREAGATTVAMDATIGLASGGIVGTDYTLDGELRLEFPTLAEE